MGRFLNGLQRKEFLFDLVDLKGGQKNNVIPGTCEATLLADSESADRIIGEWNVYEKTLKKEFGASEPNLKLTYEKQEDSREKILAQRVKRSCDLLSEQLPRTGSMNTAGRWSRWWRLPAILEL